MSSGSKVGGAKKRGQDGGDVQMMALAKRETRRRRIADGGTKNRQQKQSASCQHVRTTEKLSVITVLTASDSNIAPFYSGPITALNEFKTG